MTRARAAVARGRALRVEALRACDEAQWRRCLDGLEAARALDPAGDEIGRVQRARQAARDALEREQPAPPPPTLSPMPWDPWDAGAPWDTGAPRPRRRRRETVVVTGADAST